MALLIARPAQAADLELQSVLRDLSAWLPGEYSSAAQVDLEAVAGAPSSGPHQRQLRQITRIDARRRAVGMVGRRILDAAKFENPGSRPDLWGKVAFDPALRWQNEWVLNPDELWIDDNGYHADGSLFQGRADRAHLRLTRVRDDERRPVQPN